MLCYNNFKYVNLLSLCPCFPDSHLYRFSNSPHGSSTHDAMTEEMYMMEYAESSKHEEDDDDDDDHDEAYFENQQQQQQSYYQEEYSNVPLYRQMRVTPVLDHVELANTVLNSPSMPNIVITNDDNNSSKQQQHLHHRHLNSTEHIARIKGV